MVEGFEFGLDVPDDVGVGVVFFGGAGDVGDRYWCDVAVAALGVWREVLFAGVGGAFQIKIGVAVPLFVHDLGWGFGVARGATEGAGSGKWIDEVEFIARALVDVGD